MKVKFGTKSEVTLATLLAFFFLMSREVLRQLTAYPHPIIWSDVNWIELTYASCVYIPDAIVYAAAWKGWRVVLANQKEAQQLQSQSQRQGQYPLEVVDER